MRVLLSTIGSRGDVQPLVALALRLRVLGHQARLCVPPDFRAWIEGLGLEMVPVGPEVRGSATSRPPAEAPPPPPPTPEQIRGLIDETAATQFQAIGAAAAGCDAVVAATAIQIAAGSIAERHDIPYVFAAYCPIVLPSPHHAPPPLPGRAPASAVAETRELWARNAEHFNQTFRDSLNPQRASLGLALVADVRDYMFTNRPWLAADAVLAPWPDPSDRAVFQTGAWIVADERPLPRDVQLFLDAGEPPVVFGFGSGRAPRDAGQAIIGAARAAGRRALVSRGWAELAADGNAPDCLTVGEVNFQALFPRVAAVVHHGGAGTTTLGALAGTPQVVVPQVYDQHYFAHRVQELGIGVAHAPAAVTAESLTMAIDQAMRPEVSVRARAIATHVRRDGAERAVERLLEIAARRDYT